MIGRTADKRFVGVWRLEAIRDHFPDGSTRDHPDFGPRPDGLLVYTASGHVSVQFMRRRRPAWKSSEPSDSAWAAAARGYGAYAGRFEVDREAGLVRHRVEVALIPGRVGRTLTRAFLFSEDRLTLRPLRTLRGGVRVERVLVWRRCKA